MSNPQTGKRDKNQRKKQDEGRQGGTAPREGQQRADQKRDADRSEQDKK